MGALITSWGLGGKQPGWTIMGNGGVIKNLRKLDLGKRPTRESAKFRGTGTVLMGIKD